MCSSDLSLAELPGERSGDTEPAAGEAAQDELSARRKARATG